MAKISLSKPTAGYNLAAINDNFTKLESEFQNKVLYRNNPVGEPNTMEVSIDMNGNDILNVGDLNVTGNLTANGQNLAGLNSALVWRGTWNSGTAYAVSDGVTYNGSSYICITAHTNSAPPSASWDILAEKGTSGAGSGDVSGPASSGNAQIAVFSGTSGKLIADSGVTVASLVSDSDIGVSVQAYDVDTAKTDLGQQWTAAPYTQPLTDNDLFFDISAKLDFVCTPTAGGTLTFTNIRAGAKGDILFVNNSNYAIAKAATVKASSSFLTTISTTGRYIVSYRSLDGTNVDVVASAALS